MTVSRRQLFQLSLLTLGTSVFSVLTRNTVNLNAAGSSSGKYTLALEDISVKEFQSVRNTSFFLQRPGQKNIKLTLTRVSELVNTDKTEGFSLTLKGHMIDEPLSQGTYHLFHKTLGEMDLFMVPKTDNNHKKYLSGQTYTVIVNRLVT